MGKLVSVIIRTKNEEKWITSCLKAVFDQTVKDIEVILVDNMSTDQTIKKSKAFNVKLVRIKDFLPGKAINAGIRASKGKFLVVLSGHCIPADRFWLENLLKNFKDKRVAGVYGRQEPLPFTNDADKRDLAIVFGLDRKVQKKDPFFHNANSMVRRSVWEKHPFDEKVSNIEDRVWGQEVVSKGLHIVYEPKASVYHFHGIHQAGDPQRCRNVVRIIEQLGAGRLASKTPSAGLKKLKVMALIPVRGEVQRCGDRSLLEYTVEQARNARLITDIVVATDNKEQASLARKLGARVPFIRPADLSREYMGINIVLQYCMERLVAAGDWPDVVVVLEATYPFRPSGLLDELVTKLIRERVDSVVPGRVEARSMWMKDEQGIRILDEGFTPRQFKEQELFVSLHGLGLCTRPEFLLSGRVFGEKIGFIEVTDPHCQIEARDKQGLALAGELIGSWQESHYGPKTGS